MKKKYLIIGIVASLVLVSCNHEKSEENQKTYNKKVKRVETVTVKKSVPNNVLNYSGVIVPTVSIPLNFQLPGRISKINVEEGDNVKKGQVLAEVDKTSMESAYQATKAAQAQAQDAYNRLKKVYDKGSLPEIQWEEVIAKLEQANSAEKISRENLKKCSLTAPSNGIIGERRSEVGASAMPGLSILTLVTIDDVYVRISVPENEINKIKKGQLAKITVGAVDGNTYDAKVEKIGVVANQISKTYEVKLKMHNPGHVVKPGMICDVLLSTEMQDESINVPIQAVLKDSKDKEYVYLVDKQTNKAEKKHVEVGCLENNNIEIKEGISEGDLVVVNGQHKLSDNDEVIF